MRIRTQFTLAFLLLAVVPLAVIVLFSYLNSQRALREAARAEAAQATREMEERMAAVRQDLARRVTRVGELPLAELAADQTAAGGRREVMGRILEELGEAAPLVESFEFTPRPVERSPQVVVTRPPEAPSAPEPPRGAFVIQVERIVSELESELAKELEGVELSEEDLEALRKARSGVAAAVSIVEGIGDLASLFSVGEEAGTPTPEEGVPAPPAPAAEPSPAVPLPADPESTALAAREESFAEWEKRWREQQERWRSRFQQWEMRASGGEDGEEAPAWRSDTGDYYVPVLQRGEVVGAVRARISSEQLLRGVIGRTRRDQGEVPFAVDPEGNLVTADDEDRARLAGLPLGPGAASEAIQASENWVVTTSEDPVSGLTYGIARPIGDSLTRIRTAAARNFGLGLALLLAAVAVTRPLSRRMTSSLAQLNEGVERLARGDLSARVEVRSRNEIGQLATAFNEMVVELAENRERLLAEESRRRSDEVERRLLEAEYRRKSEELEEARRFQLSLLPERLPEGEGFELAVEMETATEVGGDYYDFRRGPDGELICAVGDATGHGARAGTMVTVIKSLFSAYPPAGELAGFLREAGLAVRRMELGRMAMALTLAELDGDRLRLAAAGMPPALLHRGATGGLEELLVEGMPLGGIATDYRQIETTVAPGDTLLLLSDGLPELPDPEGEPFGYRRVREAFAAAAAGSPREIVAALVAAARGWSGGGPPNDDMTFVVLRVR
ncbi:MAG: SpoIIE family protein phosphatase [Thermoanaerobaculia bacterium]|nr:SpoIIE family protein phosphatase [Thermoanaerobaculia bacterium]